MLPPLIYAPAALRSGQPARRRRQCTRCRGLGSARGRARAVPEGAQVASTAWDAQGEAQAALRTIVADPRYGPAALSSSQTMGNVLKDLLPDAPREANVLVAASDPGLAHSLRHHPSQCMD